MSSLFFRQAVLPTAHAKTFVPRGYRKACVRPIGLYYANLLFKSPHPNLLPLEKEQYENLLGLVLHLQKENRILLCCFISSDEF